jgi:hypothetical protein
MLKLPVISVGVINIPSGKTMYDWSIYENAGLGASLTNSGFLILGEYPSLNVGDEFDLISDQTRRRLSQTGTVVSTHKCEDKESFIQWLKTNGFDYTPIRAFKSRGKYNRKLTTSYVLK